MSHVRLPYRLGESDTDVFRNIKNNLRNMLFCCFESYTKLVIIGIIIHMAE